MAIISPKCSSGMTTKHYSIRCYSGMGYSGGVYTIGLYCVYGYLVLLGTLGMGLMGFSFVFTLGKGLKRADFSRAIHP